MTQTYMNFALYNSKALASSNKKIAVIGSGPAGLSATGYLATAGHTITVYDKLSVPGGLMSYGIPESRILPETIQGGIDILKNDFGVQFLLNTKIIGNLNETKIETGDDLIQEKILLDDIQKDYDVLLLATGSWTEKLLGIEGENLDNVYNGLDFLYRVRAKKHGSDIFTYDIKRKKIVILGAGFTAIDVASRALEMGASTIILAYRKSLAEAPAGKHEIEHLIDNGIIWQEYCSPYKILGTKNVEGIEFENPLTKEKRIQECDCILKAIGDSSTLPEHPSCKNSEILEKRSFLHNMIVNNLYIAGDALTGASKIGNAIYSGLTTARTIIKHFEENKQSQFYDINKLAIGPKCFEQKGI
ncbi:MAG: FAD-dependent oxidoreductase [Desulfovibrionaceae bacterium]